ncbi:MAG: SDR family NAD(P)-dependent oxidoreductase, partial [Solirubrobacterales bacterium]
MAARAALVTGASSGIGLAIARMLGEEGYELTVVGRRPEKLEQAAAGLEAEGIVLQAIAADVGSEEAIVDIVGAHEARFGRLDVLINHAGVGFGELADGLTTKRVDMQLNVNLRSIFLFYRECLPMLRKAAEEHKEALVVNLSSISGIRG